MPIGSAKLRGDHLITVYEAINLSRLEVYLGTTTLLAAQLEAEFRKNVPQQVAHWGDPSGVVIRCLEYSVPKKEASALIERYAARESLRSWTVHRETPRPSKRRKAGLR